MSTTVLKTKITEVASKMPDTSSLVTTTVFYTRIEEVDCKTTDHAKYIAIPDINKLTAAKLNKVNLESKTF